MMAIRMSGICLPAIVRAKTSLGLGHGTVVDIRAVMYESRKQLKIKVSLRRKIHTMALPQGTFLNARWSEDQSAAKPFQPPGRAGASNVSVTAGPVICSREVLSGHFQARRTPTRRQKMRQIKATRPLSDSSGSVSNSRPNKTSQTKSKK